MTATALLRKQHREVENLFDHIAKVEGSKREQRKLFDELVTLFTAHARIEEKLFYPEGRKVDEKLTLEAYEEHDVAHALIRKIKKTRSNDATFQAKIKVLKEIIEHHVEEEETEYFPECEKKLGQERLEELGEKMEKMFVRLTGGETSSHHREAA